MTTYIAPGPGAVTDQGDTGVVQTPNGPKSISQIQNELRAAGYNGPADVGTLVSVYNTTAGAAVQAASNTGSSSSSSVPASGAIPTTGGTTGASNNTQDQVDAVNLQLEQLKLSYAAQAATNAYNQAKLSQVDVPQLQIQRDQLAFQKAQQAANLAYNYADLGFREYQAQQGNALDALKLSASLQGPANAFIQQAVNYGLNKAGFSPLAGALAGKYSLPSSQAPQATPVPATLDTVASGISGANWAGMNPFGNPGAQQPTGATPTYGGAPQPNYAAMAGYTAPASAADASQGGSTAPAAASTGKDVIVPAGMSLQDAVNAGAITQADADRIGNMSDIPYVQWHGTGSPFNFTQYITGPSGSQQVKTSGRDSSQPQGTVNGGAGYVGANPWNTPSGGGSGTGYYSAEGRYIWGATQPTDLSKAGIGYGPGSGYVDPSAAQPAPTPVAQAGYTAPAYTAPAAPTQAQASPYSASQQQFLNSLPNPNQIAPVQFNALPTDTKAFLGSAYQAKGYSLNDLGDAVKNALPRFQAPSFGLSAV